MNEKSKLKTNNWVVIWVAGTILVLLPLGLYFYIFGPASHYTLSDNHSAWASFGSYLGGTIGPFLSGLAFLGVWKTYKLQSEQLDLTKKQFKKEEVERLITSVVDKMDVLLSAPIDLSTVESDRKCLDIVSIENVLTLIYKNTVSDNAEDNKYAKSLKNHISITINSILNETLYLTWLLSKQRKDHSESVAIEYCWHRFINIFAILHIIDFRLEHETISLFNVKEFAELKLKQEIK
ncbi:MAG: hypothetical protein ACRCYW_16475 [Aeromonas sp.]|uniref:hypothetical protein n=1 Tax=Aeromonas sp. TaxID=647 RepID=UPI003F32C76A